MKKEIFAHPNEPLKVHLKKVAEISSLIIENIPLTLPIDKKILKEVSYLIGLYHDMGKATDSFQEYLKEQDPGRKCYLRNQPKTRHSLISGIFAYFAVKKYLEKINYWDYKDFLSTSSYIIIKRHHSDLINLLEDLKPENFNVIEEQKQELDKDYLSFLPYLREILESKIPLSQSWELRKSKLIPKIEKGESFLLYFLHHLLYSVLLEADKLATVIGNLPERKEIPEDIVEKYYIYKKFLCSRNRSDELRSEIYKKVIKEVNNIDLSKGQILSFTAPTGAGKTLTSLSFALKLRNRLKKEKKYIPRIIYCLPFLSIIDQNAKVIEEVFNVGNQQMPTSDLFLIHHHLSEYAYKTSDTNEYESEESEILIEGWDSEIIVTTFVQFFHTLFSNRNRAIRKFNKILGSIVILDEIQCFPFKYWTLFKEAASAMAKYFNTFFILSTATQPAIFDNPLELLKEKEKYFQSFQRTEIRIDIKREMTISELGEKIIKDLKDSPKNTLIVVNTVRAAQELFKIVKKELMDTKLEVYFLSSYIIPYERLKRIERIKSSSNRKIVISTQLIEAGVDIDMERVIRDLAPIDSINQAAGRANRNWKNERGEVEVVKLKDEEKSRFFYSYIYDNVLINATKNILSSYLIIQEKEFIKLIEKYYKELKERISEDVSNKYLNHIKMLEYEEIGSFKLIEEEDKIDVFIEINEEAREIWSQYQEIVKIRVPFERRKKFYQIRNKFYNFVISVPSGRINENLPPLVNGIRYVAKEQLEEFYDEEIGFKIASDTRPIIW